MRANQDLENRRDFGEHAAGGGNNCGFDEHTIEGGNKRDYFLANMQQKVGIKSVILANMRQ